MTPELLYPLGPAPAPGHAVDIAPGVLWIRMPMPFTLTHINVWALRDGDGWAIVDCGLHNDETRENWRALLSAAGPLQGRPVTRVFATHMHPDHVGMAGWLTREFGCALWMTPLEYMTCRVLAADTGRQAPEDGLRFYRRAGWNDDDLATYRARFGGFGRMIGQLPDSFHRLTDGDRIRIGDHDWEVVVGRGHSPEHASLYCRDLRLMISGDQVLPRISSNVSVYPTEPAADPLAEWLASLATLRRRVADDVLVLPAHNDPFTGLHLRLDQLERSVTEGLEKLRARLAQPRRVIDVFTALFRRQITHEPHLLSLATGESIAHLNYLIGRGEAQLLRIEDEVAWYSLAGNDPAHAVNGEPTRGPE